MAGDEFFEQRMDFIQGFDWEKPIVIVPTSWCSTQEELDELLEEPHVLDTPPDNIETEDEKARREDYDAKHATDEWKSAKEAWKAEHPNETLKEKKLLYIKGLIDKLPWEDKVEQKDEGYKQNAEQSENTLFNKMRKE